MPMACLCPGSVRHDGLLVAMASDAASNGSAAHELVTALPRMGDIDWTIVDAVCSRYPGADQKEVRLLCGLAVSLWARVSSSFPNALAEVSVPDVRSDEFELTGHMDLVAIIGDEARLADWKFGRRDYNYRHQMLAYLSLLLTRYPELHRGTATILWARDQELEQYSLDQHGAADWLRSVLTDVVRWDGVFHPGAHCQYCRRHVSCHGANAIERAAVAALSGVSPEDVKAQIAEMPTGQVIALYRQAKLAEATAKAVRDAIRNRARGAEINDGTTRLYLAETTRRQLDLVKAWPVLEQAGFGDKEFSVCASLSLADAEGIVAKKAGPGSGAKAKRELSDRLDAAGAITRITTHRVEERRS
jgi:hypothetical protein